MLRGGYREKMLKYKKLEIAPYLTSENCNPSIKDKINTLKARTRMLNTANNFSNKFKSSKCQFGCNKIEDYIHILNECDKIGKIEPDKKYDIYDLFGDNTKKINNISKEISSRIELRTLILENT